MDSVALSTADRAALESLCADLRRVFGGGLSSVVAYGPERPLHTLVLVERVGFEDLAACAQLIDGWRRTELATPLLLSRHEFLRTLDVFPVEYGAIIDNHVVVLGGDPFAGCAVCEADLRRAVELQAKSHLIHLREGYLEAEGQPDAVARLVAGSIPAYRALLVNLERLNPDATVKSTEQLLQDLSAMSTIADPTALFARYVADVERIWGRVDAWR
jgi:hypothetical protein